LLRVNLKENSGSTVLLDGVRLLVARSGTASRAPTEETATERCGERAKHCELWCVFTLAQAEAYATERQLRRPEASGTKNESERTMSRCVLV
jgi:hypothetical protein